MLIALAANRDSTAGQILNAGPASTPQRRRRQAGRRAARPDRAGRGAAGPRGTPTLDKYGRDLTELARDGRIDPVIGRDQEIEQTIEMLARRGKNNPVLIGEAGVGKTAIVEGLAAAHRRRRRARTTLLGRRVVAARPLRRRRRHPLPRRLRGAAQRASSTRSARTPTS